MNLKYTFTTIFLILLGVNAHGIQMSLPEISVDQGANITVAINVDDATGIAGGEIVLEYDPSILVAVEVRATDLAKSLTLIANIGVKGKVVAAMAGATGLKEGSGAMLEVDFEVRADAKGESPLTLSDVELFDENGNDISVETVNGKVTVVKEAEKRYPAWDVNDDGVVDILDLVLVGKHFGEDYRTENPVAGKISVDSGKEADVWIEVQNKIATEGMGLLVVNINVASVPGLYGCQFDLAFNPKFLEVVGIKAGDALSQDGASIYWNVSDIDNREGRIINAIYVRRATREGINTGGTLATVVFKTKNVSISGSTRLSLTNLAIADVDAQIIKAVVEKTVLKWKDLIIPPKSILLPNYPNPFNPETWIPYQLAADATVVIHIYSDKGQHIHTIPLGAKKAGIYMAKDRAAYWNGRNSFGEKVASGVYFYTLQVRPVEAYPDNRGGINYASPKIGAGNFCATRKMMIIK